MATNLTEDQLELFQEENPDFCCPITQELMTDPVMAADGHTYERTAITAWLKDKNTSPLTNTLLEDKRLYPNHTLKKAINTARENFRKQLNSQTSAEASALVQAAQQNTTTANVAQAGTLQTDSASFGSSMVASVIPSSSYSTSSSSSPYSSSSHSSSSSMAAPVIPSSSYSASSAGSPYSSSSSSSSGSMAAPVMPANSHSSSSIPIARSSNEEQALQAYTRRLGIMKQVEKFNMANKIPYQKIQNECAATIDRIETQYPNIKAGISPEAVEEARLDFVRKLDTIPLTILTLYNSARVEHLSLTDDIQHLRLTPAAANKAMDRQTELLTIQRQLEEDWPEIRYRVLLNEVRGITIMPFGDRVSISTIRRRPVIPAPYIVTENANGSSPAQESSAIAKGFRRFTTRFFPVAAPQASSPVSRNNAAYDYFFKIGLLGNREDRIHNRKGAGKTCLMLRFVHDIYTDNFNNNLVENILSREIAVDGFNVKLQIVEPPAPRWMDLDARHPLRGTHAFIIAFDVTDRSSFDKVMTLIKEAQTYGFDAIVTLAATKCDAPKAEWKVSEEEIKDLADRTHKNVFFTSAKAEGNNFVKQLFEGTTHAILQKNGIQPSGRPTITP